MGQIDRRTKKIPAISFDSLTQCKKLLRKTLRPLGKALALKLRLCANTVQSTHPSGCTETTLVAQNRTLLHRNVPTTVLQGGLGAVLTPPLLTTEGHLPQAANQALLLLIQGRKRSQGETMANPFCRVLGR
jgi:hypothetical protein